MEIKNFFSQNLETLDFFTFIFILKVKNNCWNSLISFNFNEKFNRLIYYL